MEQQNQQNQIEQMVCTALTNIKTVSDVDTVVGRPVDIGEGVTIVPISKMTLGFLAGGGEYGNNKKMTEQSFAGGSGGAVTITPVGFIVSKAGNVRVAALNKESENSNSLLSIAGDILARAAIKKDKK